VIAGDWMSPYDGARWSDPTDIDIDHVVALKEARDYETWCKPEGATGVYTNGKSYECAKTNASGVAYSDGRARWWQG